MPRVFDNIEQNSCLRCKIAWKRRSGLIFVWGYVNFLEWQQLDPYVENFVGGADACCRLMVGMHKTPREQLQEILSLSESIDEMDVQTSIRLKSGLLRNLEISLCVVSRRMRIKLGGSADCSATCE